MFKLFFFFYFSDGSFGPFICKQGPAEQRVNIFYSINVAFSSGTLRRRHTTTTHTHTHISKGGKKGMKEKKIRESARLADRSNDFTKGFPRETGARARAPAPAPATLADPTRRVKRSTALHLSLARI
jgi:hypothetical protein